MLKIFSNYRNRNWLLSLLFLFALSLVGWGISVLISSSIPFWLLFGVSVFYPIEKWLSYYTRKYKIVGKIYRLILNLSVLSLLGLLIWSGIALFSQQFIHSPLIGGFVFLAELVIFIWLYRVVAKNSWRQPSMKLTVFSLICLFIIFAFAGVQPLANYKDTLLNKMGNIVNTIETTPDKPTATTPTVKPTPQIVTTIPKTEFDKVTDRLNSPALILSYMRENLSYDLEKYQRFLAGEDWGWDTPEEVFYGKKTNCGGYAIFALYCLQKNGYEYDNFEKNKSNAAIMLGCWNSNVPNHRDVHTVLLYIEKGLFYTIDVVSKKGPFNTIEEAATASLPTWTVCYFYNAELRITKTVTRTITKGIEDVEKETFNLINQERIKAGLNPIIWDENLHNGARAWSETMQAEGNLYHDVSGVYTQYFAECVYGASWSGYRTPEQTVEAWMNSSGHRSILMGSYRIGAIGIAKDKGFYATYRCK